MRLTVDLDSLELISAAGDRRRVPMKEFKRGDSTPLEVQFVRSGVAEALPEGAVLAFGLKESKKYDGDFAVFFNEFAEPTASPNFIYAGTPNFNTEELDDLLFVDGNTANDKALIDLMGELSWSVAEADPVSIRTFTARVHNDVIRGDEGTPVVLPTPSEWIAGNAVLHDPDIDDLAGGAGNLDSIVTTSRAVGEVRAVSVANGLAADVYFYGLFAGTQAEAQPGVIRPDDYGVGNQKYWGLVNLKALTLSSIGGVFAVDLLQVTQGAGGGFAAEFRVNNLTADRALEAPDRAGTLLPFIEIAGNTTDNAGIAAVAANTMGLVIRNQDTDDWHQITIRDSGIAAGGAPSGIPTFVYSDPL